MANAYHVFTPGEKAYILIFHEIPGLNSKNSLGPPFFELQDFEVTLFITRLILFLDMVLEITRKIPHVPINSIYSIGAYTSEQASYFPCFYLLQKFDGFDGFDGLDLLHDCDLSLGQKEKPAVLFSWLGSRYR